MVKPNPDQRKLDLIGEQLETAYQAGTLTERLWTSLCDQAEKACDGATQLLEFLYVYENAWK
jgi:hypothetical protein